MKCRLCQHVDLPMPISWPRFPIYIWPIGQNYSQEYEKLQVYHCPHCGLVQLDIFEDEFIKKLYSPEVFGLVSTKEFPATRFKNNEFLNYCSNVLGKNWVEKKKVLDVGGYDLLSAFDLNFEEAVICDPNAPAADAGKRISICKKFFSKEDFPGEYFDYVILKHIIEHINDPVAFLEDVEYVLRPGGRVIIEVPDLTSSLQGGFYSIFYHQHLLYFDLDSMENLLRLKGFKILDRGRDQNVIRVVAQKSPMEEIEQSRKMDPSMLRKLEDYKNSLNRYLQNFDELLPEVCSKYKCICYGAGGGTTILFHLSQALKDHVEIVVDSSVNKAGKKIGGTNYIVQSPQILMSYTDRNILINSGGFFDEIFNELQNKYSKNNFNYFRVTPNLEKVTPVSLIN